MKIILMLLILVAGCGRNEVDNDPQSPTYGQTYRRSRFHFPWWGHHRNRRDHRRHRRHYLVDNCATLEGQERLSCQDAMENLK